jgi:hypothetical protein
MGVGISSGVASATPIAPDDDGGSRGVDARLSGAALGTLAAVGSLTPSSFHRPTGVQLGSTIALTLAGYGIGYALATPIDQLGGALTGSDDATVAALGAGGLGAGIWGATRIWDRAGGSSRIVRPMLGSAGGVLAFAGAGGAAVLAASRIGRDGADDGPNLAAAGVGLAALAGTAIGVLASRGRLSRAPSTMQAARRVLDAGEASIQGLTREAAKAARTEQVAAARASYVSRIAGGDEAAWERLGRNGRNFVTGTASEAEITRLSGRAATGTADRIYVELGEAATPKARVDLAMQRLEAAGAFDKGHVLVVAPVATGKFNPVLPFATEVYTGGDITTVAIQTSALPPIFALQKLGTAGETHRLLVQAIDQRIQQGGRDTKLLLHGLCYGGWAQQRAMLEDGIEGVRALGVDHALFLGTPGASATQRRMMRAVARGDEAGGLVARSSDDLLAQRAARADAPTVTWMVNPDDPMRVRLANLYHTPDRVAEQPVKRTFLPVVTAVNELLDTVVEARRMRGGFAEVGHDYRAATPRAVKAAFGFDDVGDDVIARVEHEVARQERVKLLAAR